VRKLAFFPLNRALGLASTRSGTADGKSPTPEHFIVVRYSYFTTIKAFSNQKIAFTAEHQSFHSVYPKSAERHLAVLSRRI
jgi:hypothetical protein